MEIKNGLKRRWYVDRRIPKNIRKLVWFKKSMGKNGSIMTT